MKLSEQALEKLALSGLSKKDGEILISVTDNGCGIPSEHLPNVKKKFYKANHLQRGSGIGLAIVRGFIEEGGKVVVGARGEESLNAVKNEFGDNVDYKASGDNWYAVSKTNEGVFHYRKCFVDNNLILWFEFNVKADSEEPIKEYIEYIERNFRLFK